MKMFNNKKILFISGGFYQYDEIISSELKKMGAIVDYFCSAPTTNHTLMRIYQRFIKLREKFCDRLFDKIKDTEYDYVFMLNTARLTDNFVRKISERYINSKKILYCWDAIKTIPEVENRIKYFDYVFSFDSNDVKNNEKMIFLPLFYSNKYNSSTNENIFSFVGFGHSKRHSFIKKIIKFSEKSGYSYNFKLYLPSILYYLRGKYFTKVFSDAKYKEFIFKSLSEEETMDIMKKSKIVIDYEVGTQSGLTMRTIEALGCHKKLITTNKNIEKYNFYDPQNILIVDRDNPIISIEFVETPYKELESNIYDKYYILEWLKYMFFYEENSNYKYLNENDN